MDIEDIFKSDTTNLPPAKSVSAHDLTAARKSTDPEEKKASSGKNTEPQFKSSTSRSILKDEPVDGEPKSFRSRSDSSRGSIVVLGKRPGEPPMLDKKRLGKKGSLVSINSAVILEQEEDRGNWDKQIEFILACVGYAVGLGNVWRFPYMCYNNGGGVFLIPYFSALVLAGLPIFYMELSLGQYVSLGPVTLFKRLMPALQGVGVAMVMISFYVSIYYNLIVAWILFYMFSSLVSLFQAKTLEWDGCDRRNSWNTEYCFSTAQQKDCNNSIHQINSSINALYYNFTCALDESDKPFINQSYHSSYQFIQNSNITESKMVFSSEEFFDRYVLDRSESFADFGSFNYRVFTCLLISWTLVFLCLLKGVRSTGKVVYFTATFPYFILICLFGFGMSLPGKDIGVQFYTTANWTKLGEFEVWQSAFSQIFYSVGIGFGSLITLSSYNKFSNNTMRDAIIVGILNCLTSFFAGFVIFSFLGFMSFKSNKPMGDVVKEGASLAFIAYPEAFIQMKDLVGTAGASFLSFVFFFMLLTLGLDSQFSMVETVTTAILDSFVHLRKKKSLVIGGICLLMMIIDLFCCFSNGIYVFTLFDFYSASWGLMLVVLLEVVLVSLFYKQDADLWGERYRELGFKEFFKTLGAFAFAEDLSVMTGVKQSVFWVIMWMFVAPFCIIIILFATMATYKPAYYGDYVFPPAAEFFGWFIALSSVLCIPGFLIYRIAKVQYWHKHGKIHNLKKYTRKLFRTSRFWMPAGERARLKKEYQLQTGTLTITAHMPTVVRDTRQPLLTTGGYDAWSKLAAKIKEEQKRETILDANKEADKIKSTEGAISDEKDNKSAQATNQPEKIVTPMEIKQTEPTAAAPTPPKLTTPTDQVQKKTSIIKSTRIAEPQKLQINTAIAAEKLSRKESLVNQPKTSPTDKSKSTPDPKEQTKTTSTLKPSDPPKSVKEKSAALGSIQVDKDELVKSSET